MDKILLHNSRHIMTNNQHTKTPSNYYSYFISDSNLSLLIYQRN